MLPSFDLNQISIEIVSELATDPGEERPFDSIYKGTNPENHITFGGYREDIPNIMVYCFLGVIASTGWDSFPRSSLEMAAAELPILVSELPGLNETIDPGITGLRFQPKNHIDLANKIEYPSNNLAEREQLAKNAVIRVRENFSLEIQHEALLTEIKKIAGRKIKQHRKLLF